MRTDGYRNRKVLLAMAFALMAGVVSSALFPTPCSAEPGVAESWSSMKTKGGLGSSNDGGGVAFGDINDNGKLDMILMGIDDPSGPNKFWYWIGWDLNSDGEPTRWSSKKEKKGLGSYNDGGGVALADLDGNGKLDLVLMGIDDPSGSNKFWYFVGWNLNSDGAPSSWSEVVKVDGVGHSQEGGGVAIADINRDGKLDLLMMGVDDPSGPNEFRYRIGWGVSSEITSVPPASVSLDFGTLHIDRMPQTFGPKTFTVRNLGTSGSMLNWKVASKPGWVRVEPSSGWVPLGGSQEVKVYIDVPGENVDGPEHNGTVKITSPGGDADISVEAMVYSVTKIELISHEKGSNGMVNVPVGRRVMFEVEIESPFSDVDVTNYCWLRVLGSKEPTGDFTCVTSPVKNYTFEDASEYTLYCKVVEHKGSRKAVSDLFTIPVRAWNLPKVHITPSQGDIDAGRVSWYDGKYVGVKGEPVYLKAEADLNGNEEIVKYLWDVDLDTDWDEDEAIEQPAGRVLAYTWNTSVSSGKVRCRAVTNYGIESDPVDFDLKIYDAPKADPDGPYTGRPTKEVELKGSINTVSYPGASFEYRWWVDSELPERTLKGDAIQKEGYVELTPNEGGKSGQIEYTGLSLGDHWTITGEFWSGGGSGADAFYIYLWARSTPTSEDDDQGQYCIAFDEYQDQIQFKFAGDLLAAVDQPDLDNGQWHHFAVVCDEGVFKVYLDHRLRLEYDDSANYPDRTSNSNALFGFGARTGGLTNFHRVRNIELTTGQPIDTDSYGKAKYAWTTEGTHEVLFEAKVATPEGLVLIGTARTSVDVEAGKPTAMPGGPYRGGIYGGNFSPIQFEGNPPDYVEAEDVGHIKAWEWHFPGALGEDSAFVWNPTRAYAKAGRYTVRLRVQSEFGKWSAVDSTYVEVVDGKIAGYVRAADLRTPVRGVRLILTSSHVDQDVLASIAASDSTLFTLPGGGIWTETDERGYYAFEHLPLGSYRIQATKGSGGQAHEFEKAVQIAELKLDAPNQFLDFVDLSVYPVGGRIVYSLQKNGMDVLVEDVEVIAQPVGSTSLIEALPSTRSLSATGTNYSMPLFAGKYLFLAKREGHDIRIKEDVPGYDPETGLVTIKGARTDIDFVDYTTRELTVFVEDPGGYPMPGKKITVSGDNGQAEGVSDTEGKFVVVLNPGKYTVRVPGADPEEKEVDLTAGDRAITMTIPVKIVLKVGPKPKLLDVPDEFLEQFGLTPEDNPVGYMYYYPPEPRTHTYTITATTVDGHPVEGFTLIVTDEVSMMTDEPPEEQELYVEGNQTKYTITAGLPKVTEDTLAAPKRVIFKARKEGYLDSDAVIDSVIVLGDVPVGTAARIISIPVVNYIVLHDPPGDGSYSYLDDSAVIRGIVYGMKIKVEDKEVPVYPSPWSYERKIEDFKFEKEPGPGTEYKDMESKGLLGYRNSEPTLGHFTWVATLEALSGAAIALAVGPLGYAFQLVKVCSKAGSMVATGPRAMIQYEVSPGRRLETPSGDELPDLLGPGRGDIYFGEGWTLGLQTKYRLGLKKEDGTWKLTTSKIETYDILERKNQYVYTTRDIENLIQDLERAIENAEDEEEKKKLERAKSAWQDLLNKNLAYIWSRNYVPVDTLDFEDFKQREGSALTGGETIIFSGGPTFEYSRTVSESHIVTFSTEVSVESGSEVGSEMKESVGFKAFGTGTTYNVNHGSSAGIGSSTSFSIEWESGPSTEQTVGFVLHDDDIGDNISTRVYTDPVWGTPIFFADRGSITSDPWEPGTNKGIDITLELLEEPTGPFDYHDGAHYKVKVTYTGMRDLESYRFGFSLFTLPTTNPDQAYVEFNGYWGPFPIGLDSDLQSAVVDVFISPPKRDLDNNYEKTYRVDIIVEEDVDQQISRKLTLTPTFADLRAPRAVIVSPYDGQRISPVLFPEETPFEIKVVSEDNDLRKIQLQIRSKQPNGVWEPWRDLPGMVWEEGKENPNVEVFDRLDRDPPRHEFTFKWPGEEIRKLGVGEYELRAVATDKATRRNRPDFPGNVDLDPPTVKFVVDDSKPSVLSTVPDYQARESERIYHGELSVTFTDDMRADDFSDRTFVVTDLLENKKVPGYVSYSPALRKAIFVPIVPFRPNGFYRVEIKTDVDVDGDGKIDERGVHDLAGNPLDRAMVWTFRTTDAPFEETWSITLSVTDGTSKDGNKVAGVAYGASDGEDEKDARAVPGLADQLRLVFLNQDKVQFERDFRPADGRLSHHWFFAVLNAKEGSTVTLKWQPSIRLTRTTRQYQIIRLVEFDEDGNVTNVIPLDPTKATVDPQTGEVEPMVAYTYTNHGEVARYFRLDVQKANFVATKLLAGTSGWKFLSVPITPQRAEPFVNLGDDIDPFQLYQYDAGLGGYKIYPYDIGEVELQAGHGYFTRLAEDVEVDVGGTMNHDDVICRLDSVGWHAIGNPFILPLNVSDLRLSDGKTERTFDEAVAAGWVEGTLYRWNTVSKTEAFMSEVPLSDGYEAVTREDQLMPWEGYWLRTRVPNLKLRFPAPPGVETARAPIPESLRPPVARIAVAPWPTSEEDFDLRIALYADFASDVTTTLGTRPEASTGWDVLDRSEPPILGQTVAVYFDHDDWGTASGMYNTDYQPTLKVGEQRTWRFTVFADKQDAKMKLSWEDAIEHVPDDVMLWFRRLDRSPSEWQDMREVRSVDIVSGSLFTKVQFEVRAERFALRPPSEFQVVAGEEQVLLSWKGGEHPYLTGYTIKRWDASGKVKEYVLGPNEHEFTDTDVLGNEDYTYQLSALYRTGAEWHSEPVTVTVKPVILRTVLLPCYPNPFNPKVWIPYELAEETKVTIRIYNTLGELVRTLDLGVQPRGSYVTRDRAACWDGRTQSGEEAASGVYLYQLEAGNLRMTRKMMLLR